ITGVRGPVDSGATHPVERDEGSITAVRRGTVRVRAGRGVRLVAALQERPRAAAAGAGRQTAEWHEPTPQKSFGAYGARSRASSPRALTAASSEAFVIRPARARTTGSAPPRYREPSSGTPMRRSAARPSG